MTTQPQHVREAIETALNNLRAFDLESAYDDMLNECCSFDSVGGPFEDMTPSRVLAEVDPIAYRCGMDDYADSLIGDQCYESDTGDLYDLAEFRGELEAVLEDYDIVLADAMSEVSRLEDSIPGEGDEEFDAWEEACTLAGEAVEAAQARYNELESFIDSL